MQARESQGIPGIPGGSLSQDPSHRLTQLSLFLLFAEKDPLRLSSWRLACAACPGCPRVALSPLHGPWPMANLLLRRRSGRFVSLASLALLALLETSRQGHRQ